MSSTRVIPVLLLQEEGLVKTVKFKNPRYIGDPINSVRIFNEKEVDELVFLDISASRQKREPNYQLLEEIAGEAFMPMGYGGGLRSIGQIRRVFSLGFEKVIINSAAYDSPGLIKEAAKIYGSQSIVGCVDVSNKWLGGHHLYSHSTEKKQPVNLIDHVKELEKWGIGELLVNSIDRDGTFSGYDLSTLSQVAAAVSVPVIACGGAAGMEDFAAAVNDGGAAAVAAGSLFVFVGPHRAVLINYPSRLELEAALP